MRARSDAGEPRLYENFKRWPRRVTPVLYVTGSDRGGGPTRTAAHRYARAVSDWFEELAGFLRFRRSAPTPNTLPM